MATPVPVPRGHPAIKLLDRRATDHDSFITHIDRSPVSAKIAAFQGPFWFNLIVSGLLAWRAMKGTTQYYSLAFILYGDLIIKSSPTPTNWTWIIINSAIDYALYHLLWPGVRKFITGHLWLRLRWGFQETEIVFRKPTGWRRALLNGLPQEELQRQYDDTLYRAIDPTLITQNTGYLTRSDFWALEYKAVGDAYSLMATGEVDMKTWDLSVWTRVDGEWHVWEVWRIYDKQMMETTMGIATEKLKAMGKEDLIQRWRSARAPGAATTTQALDNFVGLFQREGVDFEKLWTEATSEARAVMATGASSNM